MSAAGPIPSSTPSSFTITDELRKDFFEKSLFPPTLNISTLKDSSNKASPEKIKNYIFQKLKDFFKDPGSNDRNFDDAFIQNEELQKMYINATYQLVGRCGGDDDAQQQTRFEVFRLMFEESVSKAPHNTNFDTLKNTFTVIHANTNSSEEAYKLIDIKESELKNEFEKTAESDKEDIQRATKDLKKDLPTMGDPMLYQNLTDTLLAQESNLNKTNMYNQTLEEILLKIKKAKIDKAARLIMSIMKKHRGKNSPQKAIIIQSKLRMLPGKKQAAKAAKAAIVEEMKIFRTAIEQLKKLDSASAADFETELQTLKDSVTNATITLKELNQALKKAKQLNKFIEKLNTRIKKSNLSNKAFGAVLDYQNKTNMEKIESIRKEIEDSRLPKDVKEQFNKRLDDIKAPAANLKEAKGIQEFLTTLEGDIKGANSDQGVSRFARGFLGRRKAKKLKQQSGVQTLLKKRHTKLQRNAFDQWRSFTAEQKAEKAKKAIQEQQQSGVKTLLKKRHTKLQSNAFDQWRSFTAEQKAEKEVKEITVDIKGLLKDQYFSTKEIQAYQLRCTKFENAIYNKDYNHNKNISDARGLKTSLESIIQEKIERQTLLQETKEAKKVAEAAEQERLLAEAAEQKRKEAEENLSKLINTVQTAVGKSKINVGKLYTFTLKRGDDKKITTIKFFKNILTDILAAVPKYAGCEEDLSQYRTNLNNGAQQTPQKWGEDIQKALVIYDSLAQSIDKDHAARDELKNQIESFRTITSKITRDLAVSRLDDLKASMEEIEKEYENPTKLINDSFNTEAAKIIQDLTTSIKSARAAKKATQKQQQSKVKDLTDSIKRLLQEPYFTRDETAIYTSKCTEFENAVTKEGYNHDHNILAIETLKINLKSTIQKSKAIQILLQKTKEVKKVAKEKRLKSEQSKAIKKITNDIRRLLKQYFDNDKTQYEKHCTNFENAVTEADYTHEKNIEAATALKTRLENKIKYAEIKRKSVKILLEYEAFKKEEEQSHIYREIPQELLNSLAVHITDIKNHNEEIKTFNEEIKTHNEEIKAFNSTTPVEQIEEIDLADIIKSFFKKTADKLHQYYTKYIEIDNAEGLKLTISNLSQSIDGLKTFAGKHGLEIDLTTLENLLSEWTEQDADLKSYLTKLRTLKKSTTTLEEIDPSTKSLTNLKTALEEAKSLELPNLPDTLPDFKFLSPEVQRFHSNFTDTKQPALINSLRVKLIAKYKYLIGAEYLITQETGFSLKDTLEEATEFCMELDSSPEQQKDLFQAITEAYTRLLTDSPPKEKKEYLELANKFLGDEFSKLSPKFQLNEGERDWKGPFINTIGEASRSLEMGKSASTGGLRPPGGENRTLIGSTSQRVVGRREDGSNSAKNRNPRGSEVEGRRGVVPHTYRTGGARVARNGGQQPSTTNSNQENAIRNQLSGNQKTKKPSPTHKTKTVSGLTGKDKVKYQEIASQFNGFMQRFQTSDGKTMNTVEHLLDITHANKEKCLAVVETTITYVKKEKQKAHHSDKNKFDTLLKKLISDQKELNDLF